MINLIEPCPWPASLDLSVLAATLVSSAFRAIAATILKRLGGAYTLGPRHFPNGGRWYLGAAPSKKSVQWIKTKVSDLLIPGTAHRLLFLI